jgi:hypothetical protein
MMRRHTTWWAMVALVLALAGAATAGDALVGSLDDDYGTTVRVYRSGTGIIGLSIWGDGASHIALLSPTHAMELASMLESGWRKRNSYSEDTICGAVNGRDGRAIVAIMTDYKPTRVSLAVNDTDTGIAASFWSEAGAIRYLANTLRRAAR